MMLGEPASDRGLGVIIGSACGADDARRAAMWANLFGEHPVAVGASEPVGILCHASAVIASERG
jgi:hypothetical protein